jgi:isochorismate pyruvate lyase
MKTEVLKDLGDVRSTIDHVDHQLVELLARRLNAIRRAAELKNEPGESLVEWRVEQVAEKVRARAADVGFDADTAERIWRGMMYECIAYERRVIEARQAAAREAD